MSKKKSVLEPTIKECPICKRDRNSKEFEWHHVIPRAQGGSDDDKNLLHICNTCHAIITRGCIEDMSPRFFACINHQLGEYGLAFLLKSGLIFSDDPLFGKSFVDKWAHVSAECLDETLQDVGWTQYFKFIEQIKREQYFIELPQTLKWGPTEKLRPVNV